ncbi:hypothetical protein ABPG72_004280 [Tetrahymena utriculariae]
MYKQLFSNRNLGVSLVAAIFLSNENPVQNLLNNKNKSDQIPPTKTYIWGNGIYQARPDALLQYKNFEPKLIKTFQGKENKNMKEIIFGEHNEAGIDINGYIYAWKKPTLEANYQNQDTDNYRNDIIQLDKKNNNYIQVQFTTGFVWALNEKGEVYQWTIQKQVDDRNRVVGTQIDPNSMRHVKSLPPNIKQISTGVDHFLALTQQGEVFSMGDDTYGQCGLGQMSRSTAPPFYERRVKNPRKIDSLNARIKKICCGSNHSLAITEEGQLYGWGSNSNMQLSQEEQFSRAEEPIISIFTPLKIQKMLDFSLVTDVAAGEEHTVIVTENKHSGETEVFACGHNNKGELGAGFLRHLSDVIKIEGLSNFQVKNPSGQKENVRINKISCGNHHCIALLSAGVVTEWGENDYGQLGNKKRSFSEHPIMISTFKKQNVLNVSAGHTSSSVICEDLEQTRQKK